MFTLYMTFRNTAYCYIIILSTGELQSEAYL